MSRVLDPGYWDYQCKECHQKTRFRLLEPEYLTALLCSECKALVYPQSLEPVDPEENLDALDLFIHTQVMKAPVSEFWVPAYSRDSELALQALRKLDGHVKFIGEGKGYSVKLAASAAVTTVTGSTLPHAMAVGMFRLVEQTASRT